MAKKPNPTTQLSGVELIAAERERQITHEGWTSAHDDEHKNDEMACAAACYALPVREREYGRDAAPGSLRSCWVTAFDRLWPKAWDRCWFKPGDRVRELVKAGALIAAEIDRLQRQEEQRRMKYL